MTDPTRYGDPSESAELDDTPGPERRRGTVLYADITGSTPLSERMDPEDLYEVIGGCLKLLEATAREHGAGLVKSRGDGVLVVFGLPASIEAPARAAVNAAIEMRNRVAELAARHALDPPLDIHTGINTGLMVAGEVATGNDAEIDVVGDAVNVAARLSDLAPSGAIYVGEDTYRATARDFRFRPIDRVRLKGKSRSIAVHELLSRRSEVHRRTATSLSTAVSTIVDRREELMVLEDLVRLLEGRSGGAASLLGEAGIGKSRLVAELRSIALSRDIAWLEGRAISIGQNLRYHLFADALRSLCALPRSPGEAVAIDESDLSEDEVANALGPILGESLGEALPFLASVMSARLSAESSLRLDSLKGEALERLTQMSVRVLVTKLAEKRPLVFVLEDLHWADCGSQDLLVSLLALTERLPILFILISRPAPGDQLPSLDAAVAARLGDRHRLVRLSALASTDCEELVAQIFSGGSLSTGAKRGIAAKSGGNPFFVEEVVHSLLAQGAVVDGDEGLVATAAIENVEIPDSIQDVVLTRIDHLPRGQREVLQVASVIGGSFGLPIIGEVLRKDRLEDQLEALVDARLLAHASGSLRDFSFQHAVIREVVYESMLRARRRELHRLVAAAVEAHLASGSPGYYGMLAYHYSVGDDVERAEEFLFRAGEEAARVAASGEALHFFQEASRVYLERHGERGDPTKRADLEQKIGLAHFYRGEFHPALRHFNHWLELLGERVPSGRVASTLRIAVNVVTILRVAYLPGRLAKRPPASERTREIIDMMFRRARAQTTASPERFLIDSLENFRRLSRVDPATVPGAGGMVASAGLGIFGFTGLSFSISRRLLEIAAPLVDEADPRERFLARSMRYYHDCFAGDWSADREFGDDEIERMLQLGELWDVVTYLGVDGRKKLHQGRFAEAESSIERLARIEELYAYELARSTHNSARTLLLVERGELEAASDSADRYLRSTDEELPTVLALSLKAKIEALADRLSDAHVALAEAAIIVKKLPLLPPFHASGYWRSRLLVDVRALERAMEEGRARQAGVLSREARQDARRARRVAMRVAWERTEIFRLLGRLDWCLGRRKQALAGHAKSIESGRALGAKAELARSHREVARCLEEWSEGPATLLGMSAAEHVRESERLWAELGLADDRAEARATGPGSG